jgi:hypothetical protein
LKKFENFEPDSKEVIDITSFLEKRYKVENTNILGKETKYISIDYKPIYLSGNFSNKKRALNKIFLDVKDELSEYSDASIRKAIRDFINKP